MSSVKRRRGTTSARCWLRWAGPTRRSRHTPAHATCTNKPVTPTAKRERGTTSAWHCGRRAGSRRRSRPIRAHARSFTRPTMPTAKHKRGTTLACRFGEWRSEEHTSELQSRFDPPCPTRRSSDLAHATCTNKPVTPTAKRERGTTSAWHCGRRAGSRRRSRPIRAHARSFTRPTMPTAKHKRGTTLACRFGEWAGSRRRSRPIRAHARSFTKPTMPTAKHKRAAALAWRCLAMGSRLRQWRRSGGQRTCLRLLGMHTGRTFRGSCSRSSSRSTSLTTQPGRTRSGNGASNPRVTWPTPAVSGVFLETHGLGGRDTPGLLPGPDCHHRLGTATCVIHRHSALGQQRRGNRSSRRTHHRPVAILHPHCDKTIEGCNVIDLQEQVGRVYNPDVRPLVAEAVRAYSTGSARSAIILTWTAVCADLIFKFERLADDGDG